MAEASAAASSGNLGPGFDCVALALDLRCSVRAEPAGAWSIRHVGREPLGDGGHDAVLEAAKRASDGQPLAIEVRSDIPLGRGLGSSAAAYTAGVAAACRAVGRLPGLDEVFGMVVEMEGHPDNAAAAVYGGLVATGPGLEVAHLELHHSLLPVVAVPGYTLSTRAARAVLPAEVPFDTAIRGIARAVLLVEGLRNGAPELLAAASPDDIHEGPRRAVHPAADELMAAARRAGALHACWSGAGPSVLALVRFEQRPGVIEAFTELLDETGEVITPEVAFQGLI